MDTIRLPTDLGLAIRAHRKQQRLSATAVANHSGRSRDILHRLERGDDVTVSALMDILRAMGASLVLQSAGMPTLDEMRRRFDEDLQP